MKKVLLLGSCGYIGSFLMRDLKDYGYLVDGWDLALHGLSGQCYFGDYANLTQNDLRLYDAVVLMAGHSSVKMCETDPVSSFKNNVENFINLLDKIENQRFIYASSSSVYGDTSSKEVDETYTNYVPNNYYDLTKQIIDHYALLSKKDVYALRFGTVCGVSPVTRIDVMVNSMAYSAITVGHVKIYITDIYRPILGLDDLGRCVETILRSDIKAPGLYNLASFNMTVAEIGQRVADFFEVPIMTLNSTDTRISHKLQTKAYNFSINCDKYINTFNGYFNNTVEDICMEFKTNFRNIRYTDRLQPVKYPL